LLEHLERIWTEPDRGLWELRSGPQQFTQSKAMAWVVCDRGFHRSLNSFTQAYGSKHMDASLLLLPLVGFLPADDPRICGTVNAIEKHLLREGLLLRYDTKRVTDGLPAGEGAFLACNFWPVDVYVAQGRMAEARAHFERLLKLRNDLGLLSEEYDADHGLVGNFPQASLHIALINAALVLELGTSTRMSGLDSPQSR
jgi:GH15 family glucan-1,4-alpha-glucosidase